MEISPEAENYLKTVYYLETEFSRQVRMMEIADAIDRTRASVTRMMQILDERNLVEYTKYKGVELTNDGEQIALKLVRKHRLIETFLTEHLGIPWADVHEEADRLEHYLSDRFADHLAEYLGDPEINPHGDPIPDSELSFPFDPSHTPLVECEVDETLVVEQVPHRQSGVRKYLFENEIDPGATLTVDEIAPVGLINVIVEESDTPVSIPMHVARQVGVNRVISTG